MLNSLSAKIIHETQHLIPLWLAMRNNCPQLAYNTLQDSTVAILLNLFNGISILYTSHQQIKKIEAKSRIV